MYDYCNRVFQVYLALAKGGLVEDHLLILTVGHCQSVACLPENINDEIEQYPLK